MGSQWLILELSEQGEATGYNDLECFIRDIFGDKVEYFIPVHQERMGSYVSSSTLFEGYIFIKDNPEIRNKLGDIRDCRVFSKVLCTHSRLHTIPSRTIGVLRRRLKNSIKKKMSPGTQVKILEGIFESLSGEVISIEDEGKKVMVRIKTISREIIAPVPCTSIEVESHNE